MELLLCSKSLSGKRSSHCNLSLNPKRHRKSPMALVSSTINDIPDSLLIEILLLTLKSAKQCLLVSKCWFAHPFLQRNYTSTLFLYYETSQINKLFVTSNKSYGFSFCHLPSSSTPNRLDLEPAAVVPVRIYYYVVASFSLNMYYICNPFTGTWIELHPCSSPHDENTRVGFICRGRGIKFSYAVFRFSYFGDSIISNELAVETFSSDIDMWPKRWCPLRWIAIGEVRLIQRQGRSNKDADQSSL
ncbi:hypothetical protein GH714_024414 [Hevea brasiliensis]|uniref:F-box domain-containing protein n=1 Tax=Hevea brasiliensis TaxID=3981 RepID=A0A6A6LDH0_HEVBR|nr:hypothetical protein GH714_024414 [Hevea brasiliensis]